MCRDETCYADAHGYIVGTPGQVVDGADNSDGDRSEGASEADIEILLGEFSSET